MLNQFVSWIYLGLSYFSGVVYNVLFSGELPSVWTLIGMVLLFAFWFGSAFLSATIAELFGHPVMFHFFGGLVLPYVYPCMIAKKLRIIQLDVARGDVEQANEKLENQKAESSERFEKIRAEREAARLERVSARAAAAGKPIPVPVAAPPAPEEPVPAVSDAVSAAPEEAPAWMQVRDALREQPLDAEGCRNGPYRLYTKDGGSMDISRIRSMQDDLMVCVQCKTDKTLRVRYMNLIGVEQLEEEQ